MRFPLQPPPGIVSDETTFSAPGLWADGNNVRFTPTPETIGGWQSVFATPLTGVCRNMLEWRSGETSLSQVAFGTHSALQVYSGGDLYDITPAGLAEGGIDSSGDAQGYGSGAWDEGTYSDPSSTYFARTWSFSTYGSYLIANPRGDTIYEWDNDTGALATAVTNAPANVTYALVTPERQLLAFGCNEEVSGDFNPLCIRGTDIEDITDWTTAPNNNAFEHILEGGGRIVSARLVGSYIVIWTDRALHVGQFIGDPGQAYRFDFIANQCGLIGPNAAVVTGQRVFWIGPDLQVWGWVPGSLPVVIPCPIHKDFTDNLDQSQSAKIVAASVSKFGEIWFFYPDARDGNENSRYIAYSTEVSAGAQRPVWFRGQMSRTAFTDAGFGGYPIGADVSGNVYNHEFGQSANDMDLTWHLQSSDQYLAESEQRMLVRNVWPDFKDQAGDISMSVFVREYPQGTPTERGPYVLAEGQAKKDLRVSGRLAGLKFSGDSSPAFVRLGKPTFDVIAQGLR